MGSETTRWVALRVRGVNQQWDQGPGCSRLSLRERMGTMSISDEGLGRVGGAWLGFSLPAGGHVESRAT